jgi:hypothetical protein
MINDPCMHQVIDTNTVQSIAETIPLIYDQIINTLERDRMMADAKTADEFWAPMYEALSVGEMVKDFLGLDEHGNPPSIFADAFAEANEGVGDDPFPEATAKCDPVDVIGFLEADDLRYLDDDYDSYSLDD